MHSTWPTSTASPSLPAHTRRAGRLRMTAIEARRGAPRRRLLGGSPGQLSRLLAFALLWLAALPACTAVGADATPANPRPQALETQLDGYSIHTSTVVTAFLPEEVLKTHGLRARGRAVLHLVVFNRAEQGDGIVTVPAEIEAEVSNLLGQRRPIEMREITENGMTSYLGAFDAEHDDLLKFDIVVRPAGGTASKRIEFERRFLYE